jgi:hypothetical protein
MAVVPSLVIAAPRPAWGRLRTDSGARALAVASDASAEDGDVRWIPLLDSDLESDDGRSDYAWTRRLRAVAATPQAPLVLLWVAGSQGEAKEFLKAIEVLGRRMLALLQRDRVPPRVAAVIYVAESGLSEDDVCALETIACAGRNLPSNDRASIPAGLAEMLGPRGRPVYLMSRRTRVGASGTSWNVADIWPVEVARLMANIEAVPLRQPGIRAWRSMRFNPTRFPFERVEFEAFRLTREALGLPSEDGQRVVEGQGRQLPVSRAPETLVSTDRAPQHCLDSVARSAVRPELPDWWDLASVTAEGSVGERTDTFGSRHGRRSRWYQRFDERGKLFINDRRALALQSLEETVGPKAVQSRAWHAIHDDPSLLNWYGAGQFYVGPELQFDVAPDGLHRWSALNEIERAIISLRRRSLVESKELDRARAHFVGLGWRMLCASAASIFVATVFCSLFANAGSRWILAMSSASCGGAVVASVVVLWLEFRAGRRGRGAVERVTQATESQIAEGFFERMRLGAQGERNGRRRRWFQSAARTRDSAHRLKAVVDLAELRALRQASADAPTLSPALRDYFAATSVEVVDGTLPVESLRDALKKHGAELMELRRGGYAAWWAHALRVEDPLMSGAVRRRTFESHLAYAIGGIINDFRSDLLGVVEGMGETGDADWAAQAAFGEVLGPSGDLRFLGVQTERAAGRDMRRVVWVHGMLQRHVEIAASRITVYLGWGRRPQPVVSRIDRWGCLGLMIDEVAIGFRRGEAGIICMDPGAGACVWEGADRHGPLADESEGRA